MNEEEIVAIRQYSSSKYRQVNMYLRGLEDASIDILKVIRHLDSAIAKSYFGDSGLLYRGLDGDFVDSDFFVKLRVGSLITDEAFVSTTSSFAVSRRYTAYPPGGVIMRIRPPGGLNALLMTEFSDYPEEQEVLLPRSLSMRVTGYDRSQRILDMQII